MTDIGIYVKITEEGSVEWMGNAHTRATAKYNAKSYDRIEFVVSKGEKEMLREFAKSRDKTVAGLICDLIQEAMDKDQAPVVKEEQRPKLPRKRVPPKEWVPDEDEARILAEWRKMGKIGDV